MFPDTAGRPFIVCVVNRTRSSLLAAMVQKTALEDSLPAYGPIARGCMNKEPGMKEKRRFQARWSIRKKHLFFFHSHIIYFRKGWRRLDQKQPALTVHDRQICCSCDRRDAETGTVPCCGLYGMGIAWFQCAAPAVL